MEDFLMRAATVIAVALATFSSFPLTAQQQDTTPQQQAAPAQQTAPPAQQTTPTTAPDNQPAQNGADSQGSSSSSQASPSAGASSGGASTMAAPIQLAPVKGELVGNLDSTSAKTGDSVVVKTDKDVKTADGTDIPKGSKLVGHVTGVQARGEGKENAQIAIKFDHAELKSGQSLPIESVIESVGSTESDSAQNSGGFGPPSGGSSMPGSGAGNSPSSGNMNGSNSNSAANAPRPNETTSGSAQSGPAAANGTPAPGSIVAKSGNVAIRMTSIPGVLLANNISGQPFSNASGMLLGARRDIKLDGGTKVGLTVATTPGGPANGPGAMNR